MTLMDFTQMIVFASIARPYQLIHHSHINVVTNKIICQCHKDNLLINTEEYYNSWKRQINGDAFSDYSEDNQINIKLKNISLRPYVV